jgi:hypothetical protein
MRKLDRIFYKTLEGSLIAEGDCAHSFRRGSAFAEQASESQWARSDVTWSRPISLTVVAAPGPKTVMHDRLSAAGS